MSVAAASPSPNVLRRVVRLQVLTIVWMSVEAIVALATAWTAGSPALVGFGGDSAIELLSALVVFWRFRSDSPQAEEAWGSYRRRLALWCCGNRHRCIRFVSARS